MHVRLDPGGVVGTDINNLSVWLCAYGFRLRADIKTGHREAGCKRLVGREGKGLGPD